MHIEESDLDHFYPFKLHNESNMLWIIWEWLHFFKFLF